MSLVLQLSFAYIFAGDFMALSNLIKRYQLEKHIENIDLFSIAAKN